MNADLPWLFSFVQAGVLASALLAWAVRGLRRSPVGTRGLAWQAVLAFALVMVPMGGWPPARWLAGVGFVPSVPLLALGLDAVWRAGADRPWLPARDRMGLALWGALGGLTLYASALGLTRFNLYELGWGIALWWPVAVAVVVLVWRGSRAGVVLALAGLAWQLGMLESANLWDYLLDPVFCLVSLGWLAGQGFARVCRTGVCRGQAAGAEGSDASPRQRNQTQARNSAVQ
jgi:hypothetical protein